MLNVLTKGVLSMEEVCRSDCGKPHCCIYIYLMEEDRRKKNQQAYSNLYSNYSLQPTESSNLSCKWKCTQSFCTFLILKALFQVTGSPNEHMLPQATSRHSTWNLSRSCSCFSCSLSESSNFFSAASFC